MFNKQVFNRWYYSFSVQLLVMHIKKNQILLLYWLLLFGFITQTFASKFGIPYLFLDPEYMGKVDGRAFMIMGLAMGAFIMAFNISSFILNSFRFPFLASLNKTFQKYTVNNFVIPVLFLIVYIIKLFFFQYESQLKSPQEILINIACFLIGMTAIIYSTWRYFLITNKDIYKLFGVEHGESEIGEVAAASKKSNGKKRKPRYGNRNWRVETYLSLPLKTKLVRDTSHYKRHMLESVLKQNHVNAAVIEIIVFITFIVLGLFRDYPFFKIPAGASVLLLFTMFLMLSGVFRFWLKAWANTAFVALFLFLNFISQFEMFNQRNRAYGIDYTHEKPVYDIASMEKQMESVEKDKAHTLIALENWKLQWKNKGVEKPKMVLLNVSGGGLRSAVFTFRTMQVLDSILKGNLMHHTEFISGSSGGLIGAAYYRALYLEEKEKLLQSNQNIHNEYLTNIGKDLLNATTFSFIVSDLFLNMQSFKDGKYQYVKDRAFAFENQLNENTGYVMDKRIKDYLQPELESKIPIMVISPTIVNDGRSVIISSSPCSFLLQNNSPSDNQPYSIPDGIDFLNFFSSQDAANLKFTSALRMNATFPYIMPAASLPSIPPIEVMDAGIRDNYGIINSLRFLYAFKEWIAENTSGVVVLQVRDYFKKTKIENTSKNTILTKLTAPLRNVSGNFILMQDYKNDNDMKTAQSWIQCPFDFVQIEMPETEEKISLSWHLTEKEKNFIKNAVTNSENKKSLEKIKQLLVR
ncbi:MAG: patatin-like phospholipase family protein [Bacteroidia bacterium]